MLKFDLKTRLLVYVALIIAAASILFWFMGTALITDGTLNRDYSFLNVTFGIAETTIAGFSIGLGFSIVNFFTFLFLVLGTLTLIFGALWTHKLNGWIRVLAALVLITGGIMIFFVGNYANPLEQLTELTMSYATLGWGIYLVGILSILAGVIVLVDRFILKNKL